MQQDTPASTMMMNQMSSAADIFSPPPYSSIFFHSATSPTTFKASPCTSEGQSTINAASFATTAAKHLSRLMSDHKELLSRQSLCLAQLRKTFKEAETLRQENTNLRLANVELSNQVNLLIQATLQSQYQAVPFSDYPEQYGSSSLSAAAEKFSVGVDGCGFEKERECEDWDEGFYSKNQNQSSVIEKNLVEDHKEENDRVSLPKSISVRSNGFLKISQIAAAPTRKVSAPTQSVTRIGSPNPVSGPV